MSKSEGKLEREQKHSMSRLIKIRANRLQRRTRTRQKIRGTSQKPRLSVFISLKHMYAQVIDDDKGITLVYVSSLKMKDQTFMQIAEKLGLEIANKCKQAKIRKVVFDRGAKTYHGRLKAFAEAARKQGLEF